MADRSEDVPAVTIVAPPGELAIANVGVDDEAKTIHLYVTDTNGIYTITVPFGQGPEGLIAFPATVREGWER